MGGGGGGQDLSEFPDEEIETVRCPLCDRPFAKDRLAVHQKICKKASKKRKKFQTAVVSDEALSLKKKAEQAATKSSAKEAPIKKIPKWKMDHQKFQNILKMNKALASGNNAAVEVLAKEDQEELDDRIQCPDCGRKFNATAFERHSKVCKDIISKPKALAKGSGGMSMSTRADNSGGFSSSSGAGTLRGRQAIPAPMPQAA
jgi:ribosomal protein L37AE/L43A